MAKESQLRRKDTGSILLAIVERILGFPLMQSSPAGPATGAEESEYSEPMHIIADDV
jgi:hypothetical protein